MASTYQTINTTDEQPSGGAVEYYSQTFVLGTWSGPISDYYFITIPQTTHGKTGNITVTVFEDVSGSFEEVETFMQINNNLDITIRINSTPDTRFGGKVLIL